MTNLEYLIIFKSYGTPIYSRCFGHFCGLLMRDNVILSSFLAALTSIGSDLGTIDKINFEGSDMHLEYNKEGNLTSLVIGETRLYFFFVKIDSYYIAAGFPADTFDDKSMSVIDDLLTLISNLLSSDYKDTKWEFITNDDFVIFENVLLKQAVHPWMRENDSAHSCPMGKNCALRMAYQSDKKTISERIKETIENYRKKGMLSKMKMMISGMREKRQTI